MPPSKKPTGVFKDLLPDAFGHKTDGQFITDCVLCSKENHFHFNAENGLWDCKVCQESGNPLQFLRQYYNKVCTWTEEDLAPLANRGIRPATLREWGIAWAPEIYQFILPFLNREAEIWSAQRYDPGKKTKPNKLTITGCEQGIFGLHLLSDEPSRPIILTEGLFDAAAVYDRLFLQGTEDQFDVLGVPGANCIGSLADHVGKRDVYVAFDNDSGGSGGCKSVVKRLRRNRIFRLAWEEIEGDFHQGYDLCDLLRDYPDLDIADWLPAMSVVEKEAKSVTVSQLSPVTTDTTPFPLEVFPKPLKTLCELGAKSTSSPVDFIASSMLVAGAVALGSKRRLEIKPTYSVYPVLWLGLVGQSGTRKSPGRNIALEPLEKMEKEFVYKWREARKSGIEKPCQKIKTHDATMEALLKLLEENPHGLLYDADELTGWLAQQDRFKNGDDQQKWLSMFSGQSESQSRVTEGRDRAVANPVVSVCGGLTPGSLEQFTIKNRMENGFFSRMLFSFPEKVPKLWERDGIKPSYIKAYHNVITTIYEGTKTLDSLNRVTMSDESYDRWEAWFADHYREQDLLEDDIISLSWDKLEAYCAKFALIIQELWRASGKNYDASKIHIDNLERAIRLVDYFISHLKKTTECMIQTSKTHKSRKIKECIKNQDLKQISIRDICRLLHCHSTEAKTIMEILEEEDIGEIDQQRSNRWVLDVTM